MVIKIHQPNKYQGFRFLCLHLAQHLLISYLSRKLQPICTPILDISLQDSFKVSISWALDCFVLLVKCHNFGCVIFLLAKYEILMG